jgi:ADP-ribose pyrophosphatase YjhB (NUDIX family)
MNLLDPLLRRLAPLLWWGQNMRWRLLRPTTVGVKLLLVREGQVLLVRHTYLPGWHLPGGGVKRHEDLVTAARREAREEVGARINELRLFGAYTEPPKGKSGYVIAFVSTDFLLRPARSWEIAEARFFPMGALPPNTDRASRRRIEEFIADGGPHTGRW